MTGPPCPVRFTAWGRRGAGASPAFPPEVGEAEPTEAPGSPAHPRGTTAAAVPRRPPHGGRTGRPRPSLAGAGAPACAPSPARPPRCRWDVCGESGLESRSGTMVGSARAASLLFRPLTGGAAFPGLMEPGAGAERRLEARPGGCEARAGIALAAGPERGSLSPGTIGKLGGP